MQEERDEFLRKQQIELEIKKKEMDEKDFRRTIRFEDDRKKRQEKAEQERIEKEEKLENVRKLNDEQLNQKRIDFERR